MLLLLSEQEQYPCKFPLLFILLVTYTPTLPYTHTLPSFKYSEVLTDYGYIQEHWVKIIPKYYPRTLLQFIVNPQIKLHSP